MDPNDFGNRLLYYDTEDPRNPKPLFQLHANWEADNDGLGQVRPGGPAGRYLFVTWHCSNLYCDKNHGDAVYVLDTWNPQAAQRGRVIEYVCEYARVRVGLRMREGVCMSFCMPRVCCACHVDPVIEAEKE